MHNAKGEQTSMAAGAIMGILFAPKKGTETRQQIKKRAIEARDKAKQQMAQQKTKIKETAQKASQQAAKREQK